MQILSKIYLIAFIATASFLNSCSQEKKLGWNKEKQLYNVDKDDAEMLAAMQKSRSTVNEFVAALKSGDTTAYDFGVKAGFPAEGFKEHIWLNNLSVEGDTIYGVIDNQPEYTKVVVLGQRVAIHKDSITDWNYTRNGKLIGGYSIRIARNHMTLDEQAKLDKEMGWQF